jgi:hypothetical protein
MILEEISHRAVFFKVVVNSLSLLPKLILEESAALILLAKFKNAV